MYTVEILSFLVLSLKNPSWWTQLWYADDGSTAGTLDDLHEQFTLLCDWGHAYGYFPEPSKFGLVVDGCRKNKAQDLFSSLGVHVAAGHSYT